MDGATANQILKQGLPLVNERVTGSWVLRDLENIIRLIDSPITIRNCVIDCLDGRFSTYLQPVALERIEVIGEFDFSSGYFQEGFKATRCHFRGAFNLRWGGHNLNGTLFCLEDCQFDQFADFDDDWFEGPVTIRGCDFRGGANLLGMQGKPTQVTFDVPPVIEFNTGRLDWDSDPAYRKAGE